MRLPLERVGDLDVVLETPQAWRRYLPLFRGRGDDPLLGPLYRLARLTGKRIDLYVNPKWSGDGGGARWHVDASGDLDPATGVWTVDQGVHTISAQAGFFNAAQPINLAALPPLPPARPILESLAPRAR